MIYVIIDTNIYLSILLNRDEYEYKISNESYENIISQNISNYNSSNEKLNDSLFDLKTLCENNIIKLLIPEVVLLELEKHNKKIEFDLKENFNKLRASIEKQNLWNEVKYIKDDLMNIITTHETTNLNNWKQGYQNLIEFLKKPYNTIINFNPEDICSLYRKKICEDISDSQSNDFLLLSSVYNYMKHIYQEDTKLILVTQDKKDFFNKDIEIDSRKFSVLKDKLKHEYINILGVQHIKTLYKYINAYVDIDSLIDVKPDYSDLDYLDFEDIFCLNDFELESKSNSFKHNNILNYFNEKNKSFDEINEIRNKVLSNIKEILSESRLLKHWNDRSETKLYSWLNYHTEEELEVLTLSSLLLIKNNLKDYYEIHLDKKA